jgi:hypothetical protein
VLLGETVDQIHITFDPVRFGLAYDGGLIVSADLAVGHHRIAIFNGSGNEVDLEVSEELDRYRDEQDRDGGIDQAPAGR